MTENEQAAIAFDHLLSFVVKASLSATCRKRLMSLIMEAWESCDGKESDLYDAARAYVFDLGIPED